MALLGERVESFPFDSTENGYDADGYPVYDRAVGAWLMRSTFEQFFSDGVFGTPDDALRIGKGTQGLTVTIEPGIFIIKGAMGGISRNSSSMILQLDTGPVQGNVCYGIMLRYDENQDARCLSIRAVKGTPSGDPQPPSPDKTSPGIMEYRLGYATLPSGATDMANAVITNEKGLDVCPYAAPFEKIDVSNLIDDIREQGESIYLDFSSKIDGYMGLINAAMDDTAAGYLQDQINEMKTGMSDSEFLSFVYDKSIIV